MKCIKCKANIPENAKFCPKCGAKVEMVAEEKPVETSFCPKCGTPHPLSAKFCKKDGTPLKEQVPFPPELKSPPFEEEVRKPSRIWIWLAFGLVILFLGGGYLYYSGFINLITTIEAGGKKKIASERFSLIGGSEKHRSYSSEGGEIPKAKDQEKILCILWCERENTCSLWEIKPDGTGKRKILDKLSSCHISVSADGKRIVVAGGEVPAQGHLAPHAQEHRWISFINVRGGEEKRLLLPKTMEVHKLVLSPDGTKIIVEGMKFDSKIEAYHTYWYLIDAETGRFKLLSTHDTKEDLPGRLVWDDVEWWPDSKRLLVLVLRIGISWRFSLINQEGKEESSWDIAGGWIDSFKISPDKQKIAFTGQCSTKEYIGPAIFVEKSKDKIDYSFSKPLLDGRKLWMEEEFFPWSFQWSPDGKKIVVSDEKTLRVVNADGTGHKVILKGNIGRLIGWVTHFSDVPKK